MCYSGDLGFNSLASTNAALLEKMSEQDDKLSGILKCLERIEAIFMKNGKGKGDEDEKKLSKADVSSQPINSFSRMLEYCMLIK